LVSLRTFVLALPFFGSACVPDDAFLPKVPSTLDAALSEVAHPALDRASAWFSGADIVTLPIVPTRCPLDSASRYFVCSPLSGGGLTLNQRFTLLDASGGTQSAFDARTTTSLHLENSVAGTWSWSRSSDTFTVDGQQVLDLTGLGTARHTLNGTSLTLAGGSELRTTITDLVLPVVVAGAPVGWPLSGTIELRTRPANATNDTSGFIATMQFDGSSIVTLTWATGSLGQTCRVNLVTMPQGIGCPQGSPDVPIGH
jgi:hypothetical protein